MSIDFHTHNLQAAPGKAIVNLPQEALLCPESFDIVEGGIYSVGIHPWWTTDCCDEMWNGLEYWVHHPQVVALGECGLDKLRGAGLDRQEELFLKQIGVAENCRLPLTIHCVKSFDRLLAIRKRVKSSVRWTVHGFRGKPELARQLLAADFDLSFGKHYNEESWLLTPPERRYRETDGDW